MIFCVRIEVCLYIGECLSVVVMTLKIKKVGRMNLLVHCLCNFARGNATSEISVRVYLLLSEAALSLEK